MTDKLKLLKAIFDAEPEIKASDDARKKAISAAMQTFKNQHQINNVVASEKTNKKENEINHQGNSISPRQKGKDNNKPSNNAGFFTLLYWTKLMKLSYVIPTVAAGALAISVLIFNPSLLNSNLRNDTSVYTTELEKSAQTHDLKNTINTESFDVGATQTKIEAKKDDGSATNKRRQQQEEVAKLQKVESLVLMEQEATIPMPMTSDKKSVAKMRRSKEKRHENSLNYINNEIITTRPKPIQSHDKFQSLKSNSLKYTAKNPISTFSIDVDTASYSFMRAAIHRNMLPQKNTLRVEELINYFPYDYPQPSDSKQPFKVSTTVMPTPWNTQTKLLHIAIKGYQLPKQKQPTSNLVFLLDTSGSMNQTNKLPLLKNAFKLLLSTLKPSDTVSIVAYAGSAGTVLTPTKVAEKATIIQALERLNAGGSTAGGEGIRLAYQLAEANYDKNAVNRVILATDGDFNVGIRNQNELKSFIEHKRQSGVFLSVLGFGMGNYNDALMQTLAQNGNGNAAYIDSLSEARKVLVEEASSTLFTIAKDVKIQMEFNPNAIRQYRLIGYETRQLKREDFNNDKVDAGDIGAGHTVTAIYEITPVSAENNAVDPLRYSENKRTTPRVKPSEYGFLKLRYKLPNEDKSQLIKTPIQIANTIETMDAVSSETRFATAVAAFGQLLRGGTYTNSYSYDDVLALAQTAKGQDVFGYRAEFMTLVRLAKTVEILR